MSFDEQLERAQADGRITPGDADEVRHFAGFLHALGAAGVPAGGTNRNPEQQQAFARIYAEHYPEDYARGVAEEKARRAEQARRDRGDAERMEYPHLTTSPGSPAGPDLEGGPDT